jgi:hypothetical protein
VEEGWGRSAKRHANRRRGKSLPQGRIVTAIYGLGFGFRASRLFLIRHNNAQEKAKNDVRASIGT